MDLSAFFVTLFIGAVAGWLAGVLIKGFGFGLVGNILVGIVGAVVGGLVFDLLGLSSSGLIGSILMATVGACVFLFFVKLLKKA